MVQKQKQVLAKDVKPGDVVQVYNHTLQDVSYSTVVCTRVIAISNRMKITFIDSTGTWFWEFSPDRSFDTITSVQTSN